MEQGKRYNTGKLRYDLIHPTAQEGLVKVLSLGAVKYEPRNWERGMSWTSVIASLKRHLNAIEKGEDYDLETGELHADHLQCNAHFLSAYYKIAPQYDDRKHTYLNKPKIGLDIDEVLCDWLGGWCELSKIERPHSWLFDRELYGKLIKMEEEGTINDFMMGLNPLIDPREIPFEPHCYITARHIENQISIDWLDKHGFPSAPVYTVPTNSTKVETAIKAGVEIFVDDEKK